MKNIKLYKETPSNTLNEDGTLKTLQQKVEELNNFVESAIQEMKTDKEDH